jgi:hypothetical protein
MGGITGRLVHVIGYKGVYSVYMNVVDPKNWTVIFKPDTVQKGDSTDAKTSYFQT